MQDTNNQEPTTNFLPTPTGATTDPFYQAYRSPTDGYIKLPQIALLFQVSPETIKRYEKEKLIQPLRHGLKQTRYYTPEHIEQIKEIIKNKHLQYAKNAEHMRKTRRKQIEKQEQTNTKPHDPTPKF